MRCGWIEQAQWATHQEVRSVRGYDGSPDVCPGFSLYDPRIIEVERAWVWWDKGQLQVMFPRPTDVLCSLIEVYASSVAGAQDYALEQSRSKQHGPR